MTECPIHTPESHDEGWQTDRCIHIGTQSVSQTSKNGRVFWIDWRDHSLPQWPTGWLGGWSSIRDEFPFNLRTNDPEQVEAAWNDLVGRMRAALT